MIRLKFLISDEENDKEIIEERTIQIKKFLSDNNIEIIPHPIEKHTIGVKGDVVTIGEIIVDLIPTIIPYVLQFLMKFITQRNSIKIITDNGIFVQLKDDNIETRDKIIMFSKKINKLKIKSDNMNNNDNRPLIGVATVVMKKDKILIGEDLRKGDLLYGVPGGHWESGESIVECAIREVHEESGINCEINELISVYDFYREDKKRSYITIGLKGTFKNGSLKDCNLEGRINWKWVLPNDALKLNLYEPDIILIKRFISGEIFNII